MRKKSIVIVGLGNLGTHAAPHLARAPEVGRVTLVDRDIYEPHNLVNQDILPGDVGQPKALAQAQRLQRIRPDLQVRAIHAALESLPLATWREDLIVSCLDSRAARQALAERAWRMDSTLVDGGVLGSECLARVNVYPPAEGMPCLECPWSDADYRQIEQRYPCDGMAVAPAPNGAPSELGALAAAMLAIECRKMLAGETDRAAIGRQVTFNARWHKLLVTCFRRNPHCRFDHSTWRIEPLPCDVRAMRVAGLLALAETVRVPGHRFVRRLVCPACCAEKRLFRLDGSLDAAVRRCGACRRPMETAGFDVVESLGAALPEDVRCRTLEDVGLRCGDVLQAGDRYFVISPNFEISSEK